MVIFHSYVSLPEGIFGFLKMGNHHFNTKDFNTKIVLTFFFIMLDGLGYIYRYFRTPPDIYNKHPKIDKYSVFTILAGTYVSSFFGCPSSPSYIMLYIYVSQYTTIILGLPCFFMVDTLR